MKPLLICFILIAISSCSSTIEIPDFKAYATLPASGDGYWVKTVSNDEGRIPKELWSIYSKRGIVLMPEDWEILRYAIIKNCLSNDCKDSVGIFDDLFLTLDSALKATENITK